MKYEPFDWYQTPLYYDIIFDVDTAREAAFLQGVAAQYGRSEGKRVLEPACGTGRLLAALAKAGCEVTGFDISDAMLNFARERFELAGVTGTLLNADMVGFEVDGQFDLAYNMVSSFRYLTDEQDALAHLTRMSQTLRPGGIYALGLHLSEYHVRRRQRERWVARRDGVEVVCNIQGWPADPLTRTERVRSRLRVADAEAGTTRGYETSWIFRTYDLDELRELLAMVPAFEHVATYDFLCDLNRPMSLDGSQLDVMLILRRRGQAGAGSGGRVGDRQETGEGGLA